MNVKYRFSEKFEPVLSKQLDTLKAEKSRENYRAFVEDICRVSKKDFLELERADVLNYFGTILNVRAKTTRASRLSVYRSVAKNADAVLNTTLLPLFTDVPDLDNPEMDYRMRDIPKLENVDKVFSVLEKDDFADYQLATILQLCLETGFSTSAICSLKYKNMCTADPSGIPIIHYEPELLYTDEGGKDVKSMARNVVISEDLANKIAICGSRNAKRNDSIPFLFRNENYEELTERTLEKKLQKACERAGLNASGEAFTIQGLRVLATAHMKAGGASDEKLAKQLGITENWFSRLNMVASNIKGTAAAYSHLKVEW